MDQINTDLLNVSDHDEDECRQDSGSDSQQFNSIANLFDAFLSPELQYCCLSYLSAKDLCVVGCLNRKFRNDPIVEWCWKIQCIIKWELTTEEAAYLPLVSQFSYKELYKKAWPLCEDLISYDNELKTENNQASFRGSVGEGNRSVQSRVALPTIGKDDQGNWLDNMCKFIFKRWEYNRSLCDPYAFYNFVKSVQSEMMGKVETGKWKATSFSTPFWTITVGDIIDAGIQYPGNHSECIMSLYTAPRYIAYYEVEIKKGMGKVSSSSMLTSRSFTSQNVMDNIGNSTPIVSGTMSSTFDAPVDCIAIGLASDKFLSKQRLPGWDQYSYGYHSDDGAIFHGRGRQLSLYGPTFGVGDVVGCGINYHNKSVFFTLNGVYLGIAFSDVNEGQYRPTVGIDAEVDIVVNFGRSPFHFPLASFIDTVNTMSNTTNTTIV
jgi:hypothetical protein